jgi:hypothetical protein
MALAGLAGLFWPVSNRPTVGLLGQHLIIQGFAVDFSYMGQHLIIQIFNIYFFTIFQKYATQENFAKLY